MSAPILSKRSSMCLQVSKHLPEGNPRRLLMWTNASLISLLGSTAFPQGPLLLSPPGLLSTSWLSLPFESHEDQLKPPFPLGISSWAFTEESNPTAAPNTWTQCPCYLTCQVFGVSKNSYIFNFVFSHFFLMRLKIGHNVLNHCETCNTHCHMAYIKKTLDSLEEKHRQKNLTNVKVFNERLLQMSWETFMYI